VREPRFLTFRQVERYHARSLQEHGGTEGIRDRGLIDSALASAQNTYWYGQGDLFDIGAAYAFHLAESQAFLDGNKRTAIVSALAFLQINGMRIGKNTTALYQAMIAIADKKMSKTELAKLFRQLAQQT
jgi:death-on-curing protein